MKDLLLIMVDILPTGVFGIFDCCFSIWPWREFVLGMIMTIHSSPVARKSSC